jgi:hypothetical protein
MKARRYRSAAQRRVERFAALHWALWVGAWMIVGWRAGGPGALLIGWVAGQGIPYRTWVRWEEKLVARAVLKDMGVALR